MARSVVTVGEFPNAMLAELARGRLQEEGIPAEVSGAMAQTWAGGDVPREDAARARAILDELEGPAAVGAVFADDPAAEELDSDHPGVQEEDERPQADADPADDRAAHEGERSARRALIAALLSLFLW